MRFVRCFQRCIYRHRITNLIGNRLINDQHLNGSKTAKFGIFIHWGVYAVPGWSTKGNYAEWYQQGLQTTDTARQKFHKAKFGNQDLL